MSTPTEPASTQQGGTEPTPDLATIRALVAQLPIGEPITDADLADLGLTHLDLKRLDDADQLAEHEADEAERQAAITDRFNRMSLKTAEEIVSDADHGCNMGVAECATCSAHQREDNPDYWSEVVPAARRRLATGENPAPEDADEPADSTKITVQVEAELDLSTVRRCAATEDGRLISIAYHHEDYYPHLSGVVLHYELPDSRIVLAWPDPDGYTVRWREDMSVAEDLDEGALDVLHVLWDEVNSAVETTLREQFGNNAAEAIVSALTTGAGR